MTLQPEEKLREALAMDNAPKNGKLVLLFVDYTGEDADHPLADAEFAWTVGHNNFDNDGEDEWRFAGWCWSHDHYTEGHGVPVGWSPFPEAAQ